MQLPCTVLIYPFVVFRSPNFTYSQRAWTKMTWLMLKQNSLKLVAIVVVVAVVVLVVVLVVAAAVV